MTLINSATWSVSADLDRKKRILLENIRDLGKCSNKSIAESSVYELNEKLASLEQAWNDYLECLLNDSRDNYSPGYVDRHFSNISSSYYLVLSYTSVKLKNCGLLGKTSLRSMTELEDVKPSVIDAPAKVKRLDRRSYFRIEDYEPPIDVEYYPWMQYRDIFTSRIHSNPALSVEQKFKIFLSCLTEQDTAAVFMLKVNDKNYYDESLKMIQYYYGCNDARHYARKMESIYYTPPYSEVRRIDRFLTEYSEDLRKLRELDPWNVEVDHMRYVLIHLSLETRRYCKDSGIHGKELNECTWSEFEAMLRKRRDELLELYD